MRGHAHTSTCPCGAAARAGREAFSVQPRLEREAAAPDLGRSARLGHRFLSPTASDLAPAGGGEAPQPAVQRQPDDDRMYRDWNWWVPDTTAAFGHPGVRMPGELVPPKGATTHGLDRIPVKLYDAAPRSSASGKLGSNALDVINSSSWRGSSHAGIDVVKSWSGYQSQHVIPYQLQSHPLMSKLDANTEFPMNNMMLPEPRTTEAWGGMASQILPHSFFSDPGSDKTTGAPHLGYHSWYNKYVGKQLSAIESHVGGSGGSNSDAERELELYKLQRSLRIGQEAGLPFYPTQSFSMGRRTFIGHDLPTSYDASLGGGSPRLDLELMGDAYTSGKKDRAHGELEDIWKKTLKTLPRSKDHLPVGLR